MDVEVESKRPGRLSITRIRGRENAKGWRTACCCLWKALVDDSRFVHVRPSIKSIMLEPRFCLYRKLGFEEEDEKWTNFDWIADLNPRPL